MTKKKRKKKISIYLKRNKTILESLKKSNSLNLVKRRLKKKIRRKSRTIKKLKMLKIFYSKARFRKNKKSKDKFRFLFNKIRRKCFV